MQNNSLEEQLRINLAREQRLQTELGILRETRYSTERVTLALQEVESVLKRVDAEKQNSTGSQLQSICLERDNLKSLVENLNEQHSKMINSLKVFIGLHLTLMFVLLMFYFAVEP